MFKYLGKEYLSTTYQGGEFFFHGRHTDFIVVGNDKKGGFLVSTDLWTRWNAAEDAIVRGTDPEVHLPRKFWNFFDGEGPELTLPEDFYNLLVEVVATGKGAFSAQWAGNTPEEWKGGMPPNDQMIVNNAVVVSASAADADFVHFGGEEIPFPFGMLEAIAASA